MVQRYTAIAQNEPTEVEELLTDEVLIAHPRSLLILASLTAVLAVQMAVLGMIARFYEGSPYGTGLWVPLLCIASAGLGFAFLKWQPRRWLLYVYAVSVLISIPAAVFLFVITAHLIAQEDEVLRARGWTYAEQKIMELNSIVENTKIAMYSLHLVLTPILVICLGASFFLLLVNIRDAAEGQVRRGYYVSNAAMGHQTVLVPVSVKQVSEMPQPESQRSVAIQTVPLYSTAQL